VPPLTFKTDGFFALKTLRGKKEGFQQEVRMLKRLCKHSQIISLLATYQHCEYFHLIFPWAECDLQTYWKTKNPNPSHDLDTVLWMAWQCESIAEGLYYIHHHETSSVSSLFTHDSVRMKIPKSPTREKSGSQFRSSYVVFGRHGDIKPANLLWFRNPRDPRDKGTIKISDLGAGEFNTTDKPRSTLDITGHSPVYRPPECDLRRAVITTSYDVWTLGCLYLEFITWYVGGWKLLEEFAEIRAPTAQGLCRTNAFFELIEGNEGSQDQHAIVKPAVLEVRRSAFVCPLCSNPTRCPFRCTENANTLGANSVYY
jgi:serine/threonine protein kinase